MKKTLLFTCTLAALLASCEKDPDMGKLDVDMVVYTDHDSNADFGKFHTYYLPDSILEAGQVHAEYWKDENAKAVISAVQSQMQQRGYVRTTEKAKADVGVQLSYLAQTNQVITGGYWGGWWDSYYWGGWWGGWNYPFPVSYSYNTHALILEMVNLTGQEKMRAEAGNSSSQKLPVVWYASASGYQFSNNRANMQLLLQAVDQAFGQSAYIKTDSATENN